jgi:hypothetical protein
MAARSLRAVSLAITLIAIVTVSTVAYSAYQEYAFVTGPDFASALGGSPTGSVVGSTIVFSVNGSIPNRGLYPVQVQLGLSLLSGGQLISRNGSGVLTFPPGQTKSFVINDSVDFLGSSNSTELASILVNGTTFALLTNVTLGLEPFASISIGQNGTYAFAPVFGGLSLGPATTSSSGGDTISLPVAFTNRNTFDFPCQIHGELEGPSGVLAEFVSTPVDAAPGRTVSLTLLAHPSQLPTPGRYSFIFYISTPTANVPVYTEVVVQ